MDYFQKAAAKLKEANEQNLWKLFFTLHLLFNTFRNINVLPLIAHQIVNFCKHLVNLRPKKISIYKPIIFNYGKT